MLAQLARPAPTRTGFVEVRGSALLRAPLRIEGEYRRPDAGTLVRVVNAPYAETTTIRAGEDSIFVEVSRTAALKLMASVPGAKPRVG